MFCFVNFTAQIARRVRSHRLAPTFSLVPAASANGVHYFWSRFHTVQWISLGFHLTSNIAIWSMSHGNSVPSRSILQQVYGKMNLSASTIMNPMDYGKSWVRLLYAITYSDWVESHNTSAAKGMAGWAYSWSGGRDKCSLILAYAC